MSKYDEKTTKARVSKAPAKETTSTKSATPEELREKATKLLAEADRLEEAEAKAREHEEKEKKAKEELEKAQSHRCIFFTHNADGTIDYNHPFFSANAAKYYDPNYVIVPALVEGGKYIRPLTKEEACVIL